VTKKLSGVFVRFRASLQGPEHATSLRPGGAAKSAAAAADHAASASATAEKLVTHDVRRDTAWYAKDDATHETPSRYVLAGLLF
jgi:hypothetical protein